MGESLCSKSQSSLNRREAEHHNNGLMSKHTACLMNKLFEPRYLFSHWSFCIETSVHWTIIAPWLSSQSKWSAWRHCCCTPVSCHTSLPVRLTLGTEGVRRMRIITLSGSSRQLCFLHHPEAFDNPEAAPSPHRLPSDPPHKSFSRWQAASSASGYNHITCNHH